MEKLISAVVIAGVAVFCVVRLVVVVFAYRKVERNRVTIVRGLHQQDEDLRFPTEFAKQVSDTRLLSVGVNRYNRGRITPRSRAQGRAHLLPWCSG